MEFFIRAMGAKQVTTKFERAGAAVMDLRLAFTRIALLMMEIEGRVFDSQGRRGGGSWAQDSEEWLTQKMTMGLDPRINHATLALRDSLTEPGADGQVLRIGTTSMEFGSDLPYAQVTQRNRPVIKYTPADRAEMRAMMRDYLISAWRA